MSFFSFLFGRTGLGALHALDDAALSDIGINRYDLFEASQQGRKAGAFLSARRSERAAAWLR